MNFEYFTLLITFALGCIISLALNFLVSSIGVSKIYNEKVSAYECGFHPFEDTRQKFNVRFYLVAILFIVFDLEIVYLFPWTASIREIYSFGYWVMMIFLFILVLGFIYEWLKGALTWE